MKYTDILTDIQKKKLALIYLLHGEESYFIDNLTAAFEHNLLNEDEKSFNLSTFYGKDASIQDITDTCRRFPMFSNIQVVLLKEAQHLRNIEELETYVNKPVPTTVFVICYKNGKLDARKKLYKAVQTSGKVFLSESPKEEQIPSFIREYLKERNQSIEAKAAEILFEYLGNDLSRISNELDKLCINVVNGKAITVADIEHNIGISKDYNVFELQSALLVKDAARAFRIAHYMGNNPKANPMVLILANLLQSYAKLYQYMRTKDVKDNELYTLFKIHSSQTSDYKKAKQLYTEENVLNAFALLLEYDLRTKGLNNNSVEDSELLKELVFRLIHSDIRIPNSVSQ